MGQRHVQLRTFAPLVAWLVALVLLLGGCGFSANAGATAVPTNTPVPTLAWRPVSYPPGTDARGAGIGVSSLGTGMWACAPTPGGHIAIWSASTPPSSWQQVATLSLTTLEASGSCQPGVDANDPHALTAAIAWGSGEAGTERTITYFSPDGASWRQLPGYIYMGNLASAGGKRFALLRDTAAPPAQDQSGLVVSADNMRTWHTIRPKGLAANDAFFGFWIDPSGTQLLAASYQDTLWMTKDAGATWARLSTPGAQISLVRWLPSAGRWQLCGGTGTQVRFQCSIDLGKSWQIPPTFTVTNTCGSCGKGGVPVTLSGACTPAAIQPDGTFVAICGIDGDSSFTDRAVYRLAPGATAWTYLGRAPGNFFAATDTGQLWCVDTHGQIAEVSLPT